MLLLARQAPSSGAGLAPRLGIAVLLSPHCDQGQSNLLARTGAALVVVLDGASSASCIRRRPVPPLAALAGVAFMKPTALLLPARAAHCFGHCSLQELRKQRCSISLGGERRSAALAPMPLHPACERVLSACASTRFEALPDVAALPWLGDCALVRRAPQLPLLTPVKAGATAPG